MVFKFKIKYSDIKNARIIKNENNQYSVQVFYKNKWLDITDCTNDYYVEEFGAPKISNKESLRIKRKLLDKNYNLILYTGWFKDKFIRLEEIQAKEKYYIVDNFLINERPLKK